MNKGGSAGLAVVVPTTTPAPAPGAPPGLVEVLGSLAATTSVVAAALKLLRACDVSL